MARETIAARVPPFVVDALDQYAEDREIPRSQANQETVVRYLARVGYIDELPEDMTFSVVRPALKSARKFYLQIWGLFAVAYLLLLIYSYFGLVRYDVLIWVGAGFLANTAMWIIPHQLLATSYPEKLDPHFQWLRPVPVQTDQSTTAD